MNSVAASGDFLSPLQKAALTIKQLRTRLDQLEQAKQAHIAIVGIGCRFPGGVDSPDDFWRLLAEGRDGLGAVPRERWDSGAFFDPNRDASGKINTQHGYFLRDVAGFDPEPFRLSPREVTSLDPQHRLLLEVTWEALENGGIPIERLRGSQTGVFVGIGQNDYARRRLYGSDPSEIGTYDGTGNGFCFGPGRLGHILGLRGPNLAIDTACSSSLVAVHLACQSLRLEECDLALAGGVQLILSHEITVFLSRAHALAPDGRCKTFDAAADGYGRGEGCGMVALKRLPDALAASDQIFAVIRGSAINHNGAGSGLTVPSFEAQQAVIRQALKAARIEPHEVALVESHGTGTSLGDPIELASLDSVMRANRRDDCPLVVGALKTNIGHLEAAAGIAGLIKSALCLEKAQIPANLNYRTPNPAVEWKTAKLMLPTRLRTWPHVPGPRVAGVSSFGISGTNAHVVLEQAPARADQKMTERARRGLHLLAVSAHSNAALLAQAQRIHDCWSERPDWSVEDLCFSANTGRSHYENRMAFLGDSRASLLQQLARVSSREHKDGLRGSQFMSLAGLFTGQGSQRVGMGLELYRAEPRFRDTIDTCDTLLDSRLPMRLPELLAAGDGLLDQTAYTQPTLFALEYALAELWSEWGIQPSLLMGHSVGEYVAACRAGVFSLEEALHLVAERGRLMQALPSNGLMVSVAAEAGIVAASLLGYEAKVNIAALNGPRSTVISGDRSTVQRLIEVFSERKIKTTPLPTSHAFHSPLLEPILDAFERYAEQVRYGTPRLSLVSNVTGDIAGEEIADASYWRRHARQPVMFAKGVETLVQKGCRTFIEMGPHPVLTTMARQSVSTEGALWLASMREHCSEQEQMLRSLARLYEHGAEVDWQGVHRHWLNTRLRLPTYAFQRSRYWIEPKRQQHSQNRIQTYRLAWQEVVDREDQDGSALIGLWLLIASDGSLATGLAEKVSRRGGSVVRAEFGDQFRRLDSEAWCVNPDSAGDFSRLLQELPSRPSRVVCIWPAEMDGIVDEPDATVLTDGSALANLTQALVDGDCLDGKLWLVTRSAMPIGNEPLERSPSHAGIWGFGKVLALEHPEIWGGLVDLDGESADDESDRLFGQLIAADGEDQIAIRGNRRYVQRLKQGSTTWVSGAQLDPAGSYMITGGFGALGMHVANWLAEHGAKHLVLIGRKGAGADARETLDRIRSGGVTVAEERADVANFEEMKSVFRAIEARGVPLRGIIHAAGVAGDRLAIQELRRDAMKPVVSAKVAGAWNLHRLSRDSALDWFVCFSSIASVWGSAHQAAYAAANQYLDSLTHYRRRLGLPAQVINWGPWSGGGMASTDALERLDSMGIRALPAASAVAFMNECFASREVQVVVADVDWSRLAPLFMTRRKFPLLEAFCGSAPEDSSINENPVIESLAGLRSKARLDRLHQVITREVSAVLGLGEDLRIDPRKGFFKLGLDSLMAVELRDRLQRALGVRLPATVAFDCPTIHDLALHLNNEVMGSKAGTKGSDPVKNCGDTESCGAATDMPEDLNAQLTRLESALRAS